MSDNRVGRVLTGISGCIDCERMSNRAVKGHQREVINIHWQIRFWTFLEAPTKAE